MKKNLLILLVVVMLLGGGFSYLYLNPQLQVSQKILSIVGFGTTTGEVSQIANPASTFCEQNGGTNEIITEANGNQSGLCHLPDGNTCDEWAYFRGECPVVVTGATGIVETTEGLTDQVNKATSNEKYTVKTEEINDGNGINIYVYNASGNKAFSLLDQTFCNVKNIVGDYLIENCGSGHMGVLTIYNIVTSERLLDLPYPRKALIPKDQEWKSEYELNIDGDKIHILNLVYTPDEKGKTYKPNNAPECPSGWSSQYGDSFGYSEIQNIDLSNNTMKIEKTGIFVCTFLE